MCERCGTEVPCVTCAKDNRGLHICTPCQALESNSRVSNEFVVDLGLKRQIGKEAKARGVSAKDKAIEEVYEHSFADLKQQSKGCNSDEWRDAYLSCKRKIPTTFNSSFPSVDAIDPFTCRTHKDGSLYTWVHAPPNLVATATGLNMAKSTFLLGTVAEIGVHCVQSTGASLGEKQRLDKHLVDRLSEHRLIRIKYSNTKKERMGVSYTKEEYNVARQKFRLGFLAGLDVNSRDDVIAEHTKLYRQEAKNIFSPTQQKNFSSICDEMQVELATTIPRVVDGAPFPNQYQAMPAWWGWGLLWSLILERMRRLRLQYNHYWESEIIVESASGIC